MRIPDIYSLQLESYRVLCPSFTSSLTVGTIFSLAAAQFLWVNIFIYTGCKNNQILCYSKRIWIYHHSQKLYPPHSINLPMPTHKTPTGRTPRVITSLNSSSRRIGERSRFGATFEFAPRRRKFPEINPPRSRLKRNIDIKRCCGLKTFITFSARLSAKLVHFGGWRKLASADQLPKKFVGKLKHKLFNIIPVVNKREYQTIMLTFI